jgi:peptidylprolyl isomerase
MMQENKTKNNVAPAPAPKAKNITLSVVIFIVVVAIIAFISINKKTNAPINSQLNDLGQSQKVEDINVSKNINMQNTPKDNTQPLKNVTITIIKEGTGQVAKSGDTVAMNYTGKLVDGTVFDSNVDPKFKHVEPFVFTLGVGQVIKGWDVGVEGMKVGEKRNLLILPDYGYGARGAGSAIPPNATLSFDVELVAIKN